MLDDPRVALDIIKGNPLLGVKYKKLLAISH